MSDDLRAFYDNPPDVGHINTDFPLQRRCLGNGFITEQASRVFFKSYVKHWWCFLFSDLLVLTIPSTTFGADKRPKRSARFDIKEVIPLDHVKIEANNVSIARFSDMPLEHSFLLLTPKETYRFGCHDALNKEIWISNILAAQKSLQAVATSMARGVHHISEGSFQGGSSNSLLSATDRGAGGGDDPPQRFRRASASSPPTAVALAPHSLHASSFSPLLQDSFLPTGLSNVFSNDSIHRKPSLGETESPTSPARHVRGGDDVRGLYEVTGRLHSSAHDSRKGSTSPANFQGDAQGDSTVSPSQPPRSRKSVPRARRNSFSISPRSHRKSHTHPHAPLDASSNQDMPSHHRQPRRPNLPPTTSLGDHQRVSPTGDDTSAALVNNPMPIGHRSSEPLLPPLDLVLSRSAPAEEASGDTNYLLRDDQHWIPPRDREHATVSPALDSHSGRTSQKLKRGRTRTFSGANVTTASKPIALTPVKQSSMRRMARYKESYDLDHHDEYVLYASEDEAAGVDERPVREQLFHAVADGDESLVHSLVMKLIDAGETVGVAVDDYGLSIVHFALMKGSLPMMEDLVDIGRAKVNLKYLCPQAPLSAAIALHERFGDNIDRVIDILIGAGADLSYRSYTMVPDRLVDLSPDSRFGFSEEESQELYLTAEHMPRSPKQLTPTNDIRLPTERLDRDRNYEIDSTAATRRSSLSGQGDIDDAILDFQLSTSIEDAYGGGTASFSLLTEMMAGDDRDDRSLSRHLQTFTPPYSHKASFGSHRPFDFSQPPHKLSAHDAHFPYAPPNLGGGGGSSTTGGRARGAASSSLLVLSAMPPPGSAGGCGGRIGAPLSSSGGGGPRALSLTGIGRPRGSFFENLPRNSISGVAYMGSLREVYTKSGSSLTPGALAHVHAHPNLKDESHGRRFAIMDDGPYHDAQVLLPLLHAVKLGLYSVGVQLLKAGANADALDDEGKTLMHLIDVTHTHNNVSGHDLLSEAMAHGASIQRPSADEVSPLQQAVLNSRSDTVEALLLLKANVNYKSEAYGGQSALHLAVSRDDFVSALCLLRHGAEPNMRDNTSVACCTAFTVSTPRRRHGLTPLLVAKSQSLAKLLVSHGARMNLEGVEWSDFKRQSFVDERELEECTNKFRGLTLEPTEQIPALVCPPSRWEHKHSKCSLCDVKFSYWFRRPRRCWTCGMLCCGDCASKKALMYLDDEAPPSDGGGTLKSICDPCFNKLYYENSENTVQSPRSDRLPLRPPASPAPKFYFNEAAILSQRRQRLRTMLSRASTLLSTRTSVYSANSQFSRLRVIHDDHFASPDARGGHSTRSRTPSLSSSCSPSLPPSPQPGSFSTSLRRRGRRRRRANSEYSMSLSTSMSRSQGVRFNSAHLDDHDSDSDLGRQLEDEVHHEHHDALSHEQDEGESLLCLPHGAFAFTNHDRDSRSVNVGAAIDTLGSGSPVWNSPVCSALSRSPSWRKSLSSQLLLSSSRPSSLLHSHRRSRRNSASTSETADMESRSRRTSIGSNPFNKQWRGTGHRGKSEGNPRSRGSSNVSGNSLLSLPQQRAFHGKAGHRAKLSLSRQGTM